MHWWTPSSESKRKFLRAKVHDAWTESHAYKRPSTHHQLWLEWRWSNALSLFEVDVHDTGSPIFRSKINQRKRVILGSKLLSHQHIVENGLETKPVITWRLISTQCWCPGVLWWMKQMMKPGFSLLEIVTKSRIKEEKTLRVNLRLDGLCKEVPKTYHPDTWIEREDKPWAENDWELHHYQNHESQLSS